MNKATLCNTTVSDDMLHAMEWMPQVEIPDEKDQRFSVLSYEQVKRLNDLMSEVIPIHGRGNFPTIDVKLSHLVNVVKQKLEEDGVAVKEIRLNGSGASSVLAEDFANISYNDLDLIFSVDLTTGKAYERVKAAVLDSLLELLPEGVSRKRMSSCSLKEAYVSKMVKVNDSDRWSLITLGNNRAKTVELKFVNNMRRQYEFSVDSFHIMLDTLFLFYECSGTTPITENFYPTVVGESMYGDFHEALYHLHKKMIATRNPEEIRGGGLLKYCNLLCKSYRPAAPDEVKTMERYMCSRFFIDFPDIRQQQAKLENYLYNHFQASQTEDQLKYEYLMILYQVVDESTVCLMGHERRLTLQLIEDMAFQVYTPPDYYKGSSSEVSSDSSNHHNNTNNHASNNNNDNLNLLSPSGDSTASSSSSTCSSMSVSASSGSASISSLSSASSSSSSLSPSGATTPQKPATPGPTGTPAALTTAAAVAMTAVSMPPPPPAPTLAIPTYEIVTSCQPAVVYSNGYYYTSFVQQPMTAAAACPVPVPTTVAWAAHPPPPPPPPECAAMPTTAAGQAVQAAVPSGHCPACSCGQWVMAAQAAAQQQQMQVVHQSPPPPRTAAAGVIPTTASQPPTHIPPPPTPRVHRQMCS